MCEKRERIILGLDISTACIGISLVKYDGIKSEVLKVSYIKPKISKNVIGTESLFLKSKQFKEEFIEGYKNFGITDVVIEEPLLNGLNTNTVAVLLRFNGMISQSIYETIGVTAHYISSYNARKFAFPQLMSVRKYNKKGDIYPKEKIKKSLKDNNLVLFGSYAWDVDKKTILQTDISDLFPDINWVYDKKGNLKKENFDASDSLVCVLGYINMERYGESCEPVITGFEEIKPVEKNGHTTFNYTVQFCGQNFAKQIII